MPNIISIHSCRAGTGQSNLLANLAVSIAQRGYRVGILDADGQAPGIHAVFSLDNDQVDRQWNYCLQQDSLISTGIESNSFIQYGQGSVAVMSGGTILPGCQIKIQEIGCLLHRGYSIDILNQGFLELVQRLCLDYLLIDTRPGLGEETLFFLALSNILFLLLHLNKQDFQGLAVTVDIAQRLDIPEILLVANQVQPTLQSPQIQQQLEQTYGEKVAGILPFCEEMLLLASSDLFCLAYPDHPLTRKIQTIAQALIELKPQKRSIAAFETDAEPLPEKAGLNMAELVELPTIQRQLVSWMMRTGAVTVAEAARHLNQAEVDVEAMLGILVRQGMVQTSAASGETRYRVQLAPKRGSRIGKDLWKL